VANVNGNYIPILYATEALIHLRKRLGLAARVHKGYDAERRSVGKGKTISIKRPSVFTSQSAPSTAQELAVGTVDITLSTWEEVKFALPDNEAAWADPSIITDHIAPAAYAIADSIDQDLVDLADTVPHLYVEPTAATASAATIAGLLATRKRLFDLKVPLQDQDKMHFMIGGKAEADLLALSAFTQHQGAGDMGVSSQMSGYLGRRFGMEFFANQNVGTLTYGNHTDVAGTITEPAAVGDTSITIGGVSDVELAIGTVIKFSTSGNEYAVRTAVTPSAGAAVVAITPAIRVAESDNAAIVVGSTSGWQDNCTNVVNLAFHRNWAALAFAALPDALPNELGARAFTVMDPVSGLSLRARLWYDGTNSKTLCAVDALWGVRELDADLACRYEFVNA
jgi:hypothetical protein